MKRRELIAGIGGAATSFLWPRAMRAQQPQKQRIAFVHSGIPADQLTETAGPFWVRRFYETLRGLGHTEGANLVVERYSAEGGSDRFAALAAAVVSSKPDVIVFKSQRSRQSVRGGHRHRTDRWNYRGSDRGKIGYEPRASRRQPYRGQQ
jgi:hypothetical protein